MGKKREFSEQPKGKFGRNLRIYREFLNGEYQADLARKYKLSRQRISAIIQQMKSYMRETDIQEERTE